MQKAFDKVNDNLGTFSKFLFEDVSAQTGLLLSSSDARYEGVVLCVDSASL